MHYSTFLIMWKGGHAGRVFVSCGILVGVFAWRGCRSRIGGGGRSFTVVIFLQQVECGGQVAIVDSCDALFGVQVKESFRGFGSRRFCALTQSLQVKSLLIPCSGFKVLNILIFFLLMQGGDGLRFRIPITIVDFGYQGGIAGSWSNSMKNFLGREASQRK
jgi:hypothetical protein